MNEEWEGGLIYMREFIAYGALPVVCFVLLIYSLEIAFATTTNNAQFAVVLSLLPALPPATSHSTNNVSVWRNKKRCILYTTCTWIASLRSYEYSNTVLRTQLCD